MIVVKNKDKEDIEKIRKVLKSNLKTPYGKFQGEIHYLRISPCIIAEPLPIQNSSVSSSIIDYKIICFDGKPYCTTLLFNRKTGIMILNFMTLIGIAIQSVCFLMSIVVMAKVL